MPTTTPAPKKPVKAEEKTAPTKSSAASSQAQEVPAKSSSKSEPVKAPEKTAQAAQTPTKPSKVEPQVAPTDPAPKPKEHLTGLSSRLKYTGDLEAMKVTPGQYIRKEGKIWHVTGTRFDQTFNKVYLGVEGDRGATTLEVDAYSLLEVMEPIEGL